MKLYFYFLNSGKDSCIKMEECDVLEEEYSYKPVKEFPEFYKYNSVLKREIGIINERVVILTENDPIFVADIFIKKLKSDMLKTCAKYMKNKTKPSNKTKQHIDKTGNVISNIKKWRQENAKQ